MVNRSTTTLTIRVTPELIGEIDAKVKVSKQKSRNAWITWAIKQGLRKHGRQ